MREDGRIEITRLEFIVKKEEDFSLACFGQSIHHHISAFLQGLGGEEYFKHCKMKDRA